jgi:hypothetical protein
VGHVAQDRKVLSARLEPHDRDQDTARIAGAHEDVLRTLASSEPPPLKEAQMSGGIGQIRQLSSRQEPDLDTVTITPGPADRLIFFAPAQGQNPCCPSAPSETPAFT